MPDNRAAPPFVLISVLLSASLACRAAANLVAPPTATATVTVTPVPATSTATHTPVPVIDNPEPIHCTDDSCLSACLERLDEVLAMRPLDPVGNSIYEEQHANFDLVIYTVDGDEIVDPVILHVPEPYRKYQDDTASHLRIWKFYVAIIPSELRKWVTEFVIFTDGSGGNTGAWVSPTGRDMQDWRVGFDLLDSDYPPFLTDLLVHETGHLLTLNTSQIPYDPDAFYWFNGEQNSPGCEQYANNGSCSLPDSYINLFYEKFWKSILAEWWQTEQEALEAETDDEYWQVMERFYLAHDELFLNSYAATNIKEDMAESFSYFVLHPRPQEGTVPGKKVAFYYDFPELVEYRSRIVEGLCSYIQ